MEIKFIDFDIKGDKRGSLIALEENKNIPFDIKRIYYVFGTRPGVRRGYHAHKNLKQILICLSGNCSIFLDDGKNQKVVELDKPYQGLYLDKLTWREMYQFSEDCILMIIADDYYNESDYIRNYQEFQEVAENVNS